MSECHRAGGGRTHLQEQSQCEKTLNLSVKTQLELWIRPAQNYLTGFNLKLIFFHLGLYWILLRASFKNANVILKSILALCWLKYMGVKYLNFAERQKPTMRRELLYRYSCSLTQSEWISCSLNIRTCETWHVLGKQYRSVSLLLPESPPTSLCALLASLQNTLYLWCPSFLSAIIFRTETLLLSCISIIQTTTTFIFLVTISG